MTPTTHDGPQLDQLRAQGRLARAVCNQPSPVVTSLLFNSSDVYDAMDRFNRIIESRWKQSTTDLYKVALAYDRNSNLLTADDSVQTGFDWKYTNDMLERLTQAHAGTLSGGSITSETRKQVFDLDQVGNWTHTDLVTGGSATEFDWDFTHNKVNEITGWDNQTNNVAPTYDASGNMTDDKRDWKYEYDAWYRLVKVKDQSNNVKAEFAYNALGYRLSARYDETAPWLHFAYDERWRIMAMYEDNAAASAPTEQFWYHNAGTSGLGGSSYTDAVILRDRDTDANGTLDERRYYLQNQHHDVVALIDTSGSISERVNYDPYGSPIGTFTSIANRKGYAGYEYDAQLGDTYHVRYRIYRSDLGVWQRRDPLGYVDGTSLYCYAKSLPQQHQDPLGLASNICNGDDLEYDVSKDPCAEANRLNTLKDYWCRQAADSYGDCSGACNEAYGSEMCAPRHGPSSHQPPLTRQQYCEECLSNPQYRRNLPPDMIKACDAWHSDQTCCELARASWAVAQTACKSTKVSKIGKVVRVLYTIYRGLRGILS